MAVFHQPEVSFDWLGKLPAVAEEAQGSAQRKETLAGLDASDPASLRAAATRLFATGNTTNMEYALKLHAAAQARENLAQKSEADRILLAWIEKNKGNTGATPGAQPATPEPPDISFVPARPGTPPPSVEGTPAAPFPPSPYAPGGPLGPRSEAPPIGTTAVPTLSFRPGGPPEGVPTTDVAAAPPPPAPIAPVAAAPPPPVSPSDEVIAAAQRAMAGNRVPPGAPPISQATRVAQATGQLPAIQLPPVDVGAQPPPTPEVPQRQQLTVPGLEMIGAGGMPGVVPSAPPAGPARPAGVTVPSSALDPMAAKRNRLAEVGQAIFGMPRAVRDSEQGRALLAEFNSLMGELRMTPEERAYTQFKMQDILAQKAAGVPPEQIQQPTMADYKIYMQTAPERVKETDKEYATTYRADELKAIKLKETLGHMATIMDNPKFVIGTGPGQGQFDDLRRNVVNWAETARSLGIPIPWTKEQLSKITEPVALREAFDALSKQLVTESLGGLGKSVSNSDVLFTQHAFGDLSKSEAGMKLIMRFMGDVSDRRVREAQIARTYLSDNRYGVTPFGMHSAVERATGPYREANPLLQKADGSFTALGAQMQREVNRIRGAAASAPPQPQPAATPAPPVAAAPVPAPAVPETRPPVPAGPVVPRSAPPGEAWPLETPVYDSKGNKYFLDKNGRPIPAPESSRM